MNNDYFFCFDKLSYVQGKRPDGCILCKINENHPDIVDLKVYRNDHFTVCINLYPYNPGHLLIFPVRHITDIRDFTDHENKIFTALNNNILNVLDSLYKRSGYNIGLVKTKINEAAQ